MALFGNIKSLDKQIISLGFLREVFDYLTSQRLPIIPSKVELGKGICAISSVYESKPRSEIPYESHLKNIDLQYVLLGNEIIEVNSKKNLKVLKEYDPEKDVIFYDNSTLGSSLLMSPGLISILFPEDAHIPGIISKEKEMMSKIVIKYPINLI